MDRHWHDRAAVVARWAGLAVVLAGAVLVLWMTRFFTEWPETYVGSGPSMEPTVKPGEYFTVRSPVGELRPGMLVIFRFVHEDGTVFHVLRRLAALPGDSVVLLSDTRDIVGWPDSRFLGFIPGTALESEAGRMLWAPTRGGMFLRRLR